MGRAFFCPPSAGIGVQITPAFVRLKWKQKSFWINPDQFYFNYKSDGTRPLRISPHSDPIDMHMFYKKGIHCFDFSNIFNTNDFQKI